MKAVQALWITPSTVTATSDSDADAEDSGLSGGPGNVDFLWCDASVSATELLEASSVSVRDGIHTDRYIIPSDLNFNISEFRLLCAQMVQPPSTLTDSDLDNQYGDDTATDPVHCVSACLDDVVSVTLGAWREVIKEDMRHSVQKNLLSDFPMDDLLPAASSKAQSRTGSTFLRHPSFKVWWKSKQVDLGQGDDDIVTDGVSGSEDSSGGSELLLIPSNPSPTVYAALRAAGQVFHASFLSADSTHTIIPVNTTTGTSICGIDVLIGRSDNETAKGLCLADKVRKMIYSDALDILVSALLSRHSTLSATLESYSTDNKGSRSQQVDRVSQLFEDYCLQVLFDLQLCESTLHVDDAPAITAMENVKSQWTDSVDPINTHLLLPLISDELKEFVKNTHLLLPHAGSREKLQELQMSNALPAPSLEISAGSTETSINKENSVKGKPDGRPDYLSHLFASSSSNKKAVSSSTGASRGSIHSATR